MNEPIWFVEDADAPAFRFDTPVLANAAGGDEELPPQAVVDTGVIDPARILFDRPDVLASYFKDFYGALNDRHSDAWIKRVGGETPEAYARYWFETYGRAEGYDPARASALEERVEILRQIGGEAAGPAKVTFDGLSLDILLANRPDVLRAYYEGYYGDGNDRHSTAWVKRVGGDAPQDYANYWYEKYGRWEGYGNGTAAASEQIDVERLLQDRPDVFRAFYEQFYGPNNDRKSHAWAERVGGETVQDYAKYWYVTYGAKAGYTQRATAEPEPPLPDEDGDPQPPWIDPQDPDYHGWAPPPPSSDTDFFG